MRTFVLVVLSVAAFACNGGKTHKVPPPDDRVCGDGNLDVDLGEECDGTALNMQTCQTSGFDDGQLACSKMCKFDTSLCTRHCGDGVVNNGESCDGDAGITACVSFGFNACNATCKVDVSHCVPVLLTSAPGLMQVAGGAAVLGDLDPKGPGDLVQVVPTFYRVETFAYVMGQGFPASRKLSFQRTPVEALPGDLDGDGHQDVAARNDDGTLDAYLSGSNQFSLATWPDAGCGFSKLLAIERHLDGGPAGVVGLGCTDAGVSGAVLFARGLSNVPRQVSVGATVATAADFDHDGTLDLLAVTPGGGLAVVPESGGAQQSFTLPASPSELSAGDLDGDGDLDLLVVSGGAVRAWENTGGGFAERQNLAGTSATLPRIADVDLDGQPDLLWVEGGQLQFRRNQSGFTFTASVFPLGSGVPLSLDVGDVDGDGDPDVEVTFSLGGAQTQTYLLLNQVK